MRATNKRKSFIGYPRRQQVETKNWQLVDFQEEVEEVKLQRESIENWLKREKKTV